MLKVHELVIVYFVGGLTFVPLLLYIIFVFASTSPVRANIPATFEKDKPSKQISEKSGWIRLSSSYKPKGSESNMAVLMSGIQSYVQGSKRQKGLVYAQLKCNALFIYESNPDDQEQQTDCKLIIPVHNYTISLYPEKNGEQDVFGKETSIHLSPKTNLNTDSTKLEIHDGDRLDSYPSAFNTNEFYIHCSRPIDKEDWYFGLLVAKDMMEESPNVAHVEMMDKTHFCMSAIEKLIVAIHQDEDYRQVQWLNAILGRVFLGLYKTDEIKEYLQDKILKKIKNVKLPSFLGEIVVQSITIGDSIPLVTQPKLLSLTPEGDLLAEATVDYTGGLGVVIQTDFNFSYSSLMKPIRVPLVLSVTLKSMAGKLLLKVKPPPTNRFWVGFYQMPQMEWEIAPIVSDKQIRFSMVTNAIQSKIREFIAENIVLPNMDDFPFFSCTGKGGVFGSRVPKPSSPETQQQDILPKRSDSVQNTISITDDAAKKKKMADAAEILEKDEHSNALLQPHSLSACGTESINVDEPEIINCQINHFSTPNPFSPGINHLGARGYSSPELSESDPSKPPSFELSNELNDQTVLTDDSSSVSSPFFSSDQISSDLSPGIGLRKRHLPLSRGPTLVSSLAEEQLQRNHSYHDSESKLQIDSQEPVIISMASHYSENDLYTYTKDSIDLKGREKNMSSTCSSSSSITTATSKSATTAFGKSSLFFKFGNNNNNNNSAKQHEKKSDARKSIFLNTKKDEIYSLANNIFKKTKPTKNLRKESGENSKGRSEEQTQLKISSFPPPLPPPRKSNNPARQTALVGSDNCVLSDEHISIKTFPSNEEYKPSPVVSKLNVSDNDELNLLEPFILSSSSPPPYHQRIDTFSFA